MKELRRYVATVTVSTDCSDDTDSILLEAARELYKSGELRISRKYDSENDIDRTVVELNLWSEEEEKETPQDLVEEKKEEYNEYIEDERNPSGIVSRLGKFFGGI